MNYITVDNKLVLIDGKPIITPNEPESQEKTLDITANGIYTAEPDSGKMLSKVTANVNVPSKPEQTKSVTITSNGTTTVTPDSGHTLSSVTITTNVPSSGINGTLIDNFVVEDGILQFGIPQEDYPNYRNYYIKKSTIKFGLFLSTITNSSSGAAWRVTHETSSDWAFSANYVNVTQEGVMYNFTINLADSGGYYYNGTVSVYAITA